VQFCKLREVYCGRSAPHAKSPWRPASARRALYDPDWPRAGSQRARAGRRRRGRRRRSALPRAPRCGPPL